MPRVEDYEILAPFSVDELVSAANAILRERPALTIQPRTVRYYISEGLLPKPSGGPKFARYQLEHLRRIVAVRLWIDEGLSLEECRWKLEGRDHDLPLEPPVRHGRREPLKPPAASPSVVIQAPLSAPGLWEEPPAVGDMVRRIRLTSHSVLEVHSGVRLVDELERIEQEVRRLRSQGIQ